MKPGCLNGKVLSTRGGHLTILASTGMKYKIKVVSTTLDISDAVFIHFDYVRNRVIDVTKADDAEMELTSDFTEVKEEQSLPELEDPGPCGAGSGVRGVSREQEGERLEEDELSSVWNPANWCPDYLE